jgi:hypothetical protein
VSTAESSRWNLRKALSHYDAVKITHSTWFIFIGTVVIEPFFTFTRVAKWVTLSSFESNNGTVGVIGTPSEQMG